MEEDPREGRKWQEKWTYYLAVPMAALQAIGQVNIFNNSANQIVCLRLFRILFFKFYPLAYHHQYDCSTMFAIWLGELISEFGLRIRFILIIFAGIVARINYDPGIIADETMMDWFDLHAAA
jgi:preprotein translocase subunit SecY